MLPFLIFSQYPQPGFPFLGTVSFFRKRGILWFLSQFPAAHDQYFFPAPNRSDSFWFYLVVVALEVAQKGLGFG